jgi:3-hydroxyisobutyrate dehydrogenase
MRIAWLGTGLMGRPMAARLLAAGHEVTVWNRTPEHARALVEAGATLAVDPAAAVAGSEIVFAMLRDGPVTRGALLAGEPAPDLAGKAVVQMATIAPEESRDLARAVGAAGGEYLEAPVLGSIPQATAGTLRIFAGGDAGLLARLRPLLEPIGGEPRRVGEVGAAATMKLAFNQLIAGLAATFTLSLGLVRRSGLAVDDFLEILRASPFHTVSFDGRMPRFLGRDYSNPNFPLELLLKDVDLARAEAARLGLATVGIDGVRELVRLGVDAGWGGADYGALYEAVDPPR